MKRQAKFRYTKPLNEFSKGGSSDDEKKR